MSEALEAQVGEKIRLWKPYPAYKDSGVEWLGAIPEDWSLAPLKRVVHINPEVLAEDTDPDFTLRYVDIGNVNSVGEIVGEEMVSFDQAPSRARRKVRSGDSIISTVRTYLKAIALIEGATDDLIVSTGFAVLRPSQRLLPRYLWRVLQSQPFVQSVVSHSEGVSYPAVSPSELGRLPIWFPTMGDQATLAGFLDRETAKIEALIAKKRAMIHLIQERLEAFLSNQVLAPKGSSDPARGEPKSNQAVSDSWREMRLRDVSMLIQTGPFGSQLHFEDYVRGGIPTVNPANIVDGRLVRDPRAAVDEKTRDRLRRHVLKEGDIVLARRGEMGRSALVGSAEAGWLCGTGSLLVRPDGARVLPPYLATVLGTRRIREWLSLECKGTTMDNLNASIVGRIPLVCPSLQEQDRIIKAIDSERSKAASVVVEIRSAVERLEEFRVALIFAAVTGKIDVREVA